MTWQEYNAQKEREKIEYAEQMAAQAALEARREEREKIARIKDEKTAITMLQEKCDLGLICRVTGLPESRVKELEATMRPAS